MSTLIIRLMVAVALTALFSAARAQTSTPTAAQADAFVAQAEKELADFSLLANRAQWINSTYITDDTDALAAEFGARSTEMGARFA